jgi:NTE family protein
LALGSGAARGWAHIGVIEALSAAGIEADIVCGSSIGALVGGAFACGRIEELEAWARGITWQRIVGMLDVGFTSGGLVEGVRLTRFLRELHGDPPIEALPLPFAAIATDLETGREVWLQEGSLVEAVRASMAMPGLFSPARLADRWLVDGGLVNPVPVSACRALGAEIVIAVNLNGGLLGRRHVAQHPQAQHPRGDEKRRGEGWPKNRSDLMERLMRELPAAIGEGARTITGSFLGMGTDSPGYFDVVVGSINIMQDHITRSRMAGEPPDVMLIPRLNRIGLLELNRADEAIEEGRAAVRRALPALRGALGGDGGPA